MKIFRTLSRGMTGKTALIILSVIVALHISLMYWYIKESRLERQHAMRDAVIQKIINAIYLVEATPLSNRQHAVSVMDDPDLHVTLTKKATNTLQFNEISFWKISQALQDKLYSFAISIKLSDQQWLNFTATVSAHVLVRQLLLIAIEILVFGALLFIVWSINRFSKPLEKFKHAADTLGIDLKSKPLNVYGPSVVREAAEAMNRMQSRILDLVRDRTQVLAAISHDLRTPITRMKLRTQLASRAGIDPGFKEDLEEMEAMIDETLAFARADAQHEDKVKLDLVSLISTVCEEARDMSYDVQLHCEIHRLPFLGRKIALKRAFNNLVHNALRYGHRAEVTVRHKKERIIVLIEDDGPGIPEEEFEKVLEPFYRGEKSRSRDTGGCGLGLAVVQTVIRAHHGTISLSNRKQGGLRVQLEFAARL